MPTILPRVNVTFQPETYQFLEEVSKRKHESLSNTVSQLVEKAILLSEDLALSGLAGKRLTSFRKDLAFSTEDLLHWNKTRKKK